MSTTFEDRNLSCIDCGNLFVWTAGEQRFYSEKGFTNEPRRCVDCRQRKKQTRSDTGEGGGPRPEGDRGGGDRGGPRGPRFDRGRPGGDMRAPSGGAPFERRPREMRDFSCVICGTTAKLPFMGDTGEPVYCLDCYSGRGPGVRRRRGAESAAPGEDVGDEAALAADETVLMDQSDGGDDEGDESNSIPLPTRDSDDPPTQLLQEPLP